MKFKVTKKEMRENFRTIIGIGYCNAQYLLYYESPIAYSDRVEGWACDYYDVDGVLISTGYGHLPTTKGVKGDYATLQEYDGEASQIISNHTLEWETRKAQVTGLLKKFVREATGKE